MRTDYYSKFIFVRKTAVFLALVLSAGGCLKNDDATVLLPLPIGDVVGVDPPPGMLDDIQINEGTAPPDIVGNYVADSMTIERASDDYWNAEFYNLYMSFTNVVGRNFTTYKERQSTSSATSSLARIIGSGNDFTVYFVMEMSDPVEQWKCKTFTVISGTLTSQGIANFQYSNAMLEKNDPLDKLMNVGEYHVYNNRGGIVMSRDW